MRIQKMRPEIYEKADRLLFMPELFGYLLTGKKYNEYTMASTGELLNAKARDWDFDLIKKAGLRTDIFGELVQPATDDRRSASGSDGGDRSFRCESHCSRKP